MPVLAHPSLRQAQRGQACLSSGRLQGRYINDCEDLPFCGRIDGRPVPVARQYRSGMRRWARLGERPSQATLTLNAPFAGHPPVPSGPATPDGASGPSLEIGGGGGIRPPGELAPTSDFKSGALNQLSHSSGLRFQAEVWPTEVNRLGAPPPHPAAELRARGPGQ